MNASLRNCLVAVSACSMCVVSACDSRDGEGDSPDSTSRFERGIDRVGEKLETAAGDVGTAVKEARIQMVVDNIKGLDSVQVEITEDGAVTLIGSVASAAVRADAEHLVRSIEGVAYVRNSIAIAGRADDTTVIHTDTTGTSAGDTM